MEMKNKCETSIAPFVRKTYQLVSNRLTDDIVVWGIHNNSFIIFDPMFFSQQVLPAYFKHNNFTSYIRQLNDYGFRKVDPDRWEFANQWFLRGQEELLCNITRKLKSSKNVGGYKREVEMEEQQELREEVSRLKEKQRQLEEELHRMTRCIEAIETRLIRLLSKDRPQLLINDGTIMLDNGNRELMLGEKKRRKVMSTDSTPCSYNSSSMAISSEEEDDWAVGLISSSTNYQVVSHGIEVDNKFDSFHTLSAPASYDKAVAVAAAEEVDGGHSQPLNQIPYPFSLLEGAF